MAQGKSGIFNASQITQHMDQSKPITLNYLAHFGGARIKTWGS